MSDGYDFTYFIRESEYATSFQLCSITTELTINTTIFVDNQTHGFVLPIC